MGSDQLLNLLFCIKPMGLANRGPVVGGGGGLAPDLIFSAVSYSPHPRLPFHQVERPGADIPVFGIHLKTAAPRIFQPPGGYGVRAIQVAEPDGRGRAGGCAGRLIGLQSNAHAAVARFSNGALWIDISRLEGAGTDAFSAAVAVIRFNQDQVVFVFINSVVGTGLQAGRIIAVLAHDRKVIHGKLREGAGRADPVNIHSPGFGRCPVHHLTCDGA